MGTPEANRTEVLRSGPSSGFRGQMPGMVSIRLVQVWGEARVMEDSEKAGKKEGF